jgi:ubiquinone/menaquinone biosynthesis C-methylase UbiE
MKKTENTYLGGFGPIDGTVEFYGRIHSLITKDSKVLNLGAGRGSWFYTDTCDLRRNLQTFKGKVVEYSCADIDENVLNNPTSDRNIVLKNGKVDLPSGSIDLIICDWVLEHVESPDLFLAEVNRLLKVEGIFAARTPHECNYVSIIARLLPNRFHKRIVRWVQPNRESIDVFPTKYRMNSRTKLSKQFFNFEDFSYLYRSEPAYNFASDFYSKILERIESVAPRATVSQIFVFKVKKYNL